MPVCTILASAVFISTQDISQEWSTALGSTQRQVQWMLTVNYEYDESLTFGGGTVLCVFVMLCNHYVMTRYKTLFSHLMHELSEWFVTKKTSWPHVSWDLIKPTLSFKSKIPIEFTKYENWEPLQCDGLLAIKILSNIIHHVFKTSLDVGFPNSAQKIPSQHVTFLFLWVVFVC